LYYLLFFVFNTHEQELKKQMLLRLCFAVLVDRESHKCRSHGA
jgi:hypothetical protein